VYRRWHRVLAEYDGDRMCVAEAWTQTAESMARFVRADEMQQSFNFAWLLADWSTAAFAKVITGTFVALADVHAQPSWVLSNHDVPRHTTRYGGGPVGLARARAATLTMLALPGSAYLYQGEELGLEQVDVAREHRQDPAYLRQKGTPQESAWVGRDGCRVPIPWAGDRPPYAFGPRSEQPWIPQPLDWGHVSVEAQEKDAENGGDPTLAFYRRALAARREHALGSGDTVESLTSEGDVLALRRGSLTVVLNAGSEPVELPAGDVVIASGPLKGRLLLPDTAAWLTG
jgi:alpha-glucosidase